MDEIKNGQKWKSYPESWSWKICTSKSIKLQSRWINSWVGQLCSWSRCRCVMQNSFQISASPLWTSEWLIQRSVEQQWWNVISVHSHIGKRISMVDDFPLGHLEIPTETLYSITEKKNVKLIFKPNLTEDFGFKSDQKIKITSQFRSKIIQNWIPIMGELLDFWH